VMLWAQEKNYAEFSLGMAPLSNVGASPYARINERLAALAFRYGNNLYNYQGVRKYKEKFKPTTETGREFFRMMRDYTVVGYYTTKIGLESLGYPGLRTSWPKMPGCTHPDDPEHAHLREPKISNLPALRSAG